MREARSVRAVEPDASPARGGLVLVLRFLGVSVLNYAFGIVLAWLLPPSQFGVVSVLQMALWVAGMMLNSGFPWTLAWHMAGSREGGHRRRVDEIFRASVLGNLGLALLLCLAAVGALASGLLGAEATPIVVAALAMLPFLAVNAVGRGALHGSARFGGLASVQVLEVLAKVVIGLGLVAALGLQAEGVALGFLGGAIVASGAAMWFLRDLLPGRGPLAPSAVFRTAGPLFVGMSGFALLMGIDVLTLPLLGAGAGVTGATMALYQVGVMFASGLYFVGDALVDALFPFIVERRHVPDRSHRYVARGIRWILLVVVPIQIVIAIAPAPFVDLLFPDAYLAAVPLVRLLALGSIGMLAASLFAKSLQGLGERSAAGAGVVTGLAVEIALLLVLVPRHGAVGAALSSAAGSWVAAGSLGYRYRRVVGLATPEARRLLRPVLAIAPLAAAAALAAREPLVPALLTIALGLVGYALAAIALGLVGRGDLDTVGQTVAGLFRRSRGRASGEEASEGSGRMPMPRRAAARVRDTMGRLPSSVRWAAAVTLVAAALLGVNLSKSPDTQYDEVVYTRAAQSVATTGELTWTGRPLFVHPPLYFIVQAGWLDLTGAADEDLLEAVPLARVLTVACTSLAIGLAAFLAYELAAAASRRRRALIAVAVGGLLALDPVMLRYGRLGMIEPLAILAALSVLVASRMLRDRPGRIAVPVLGLLTGLSLLVKEVTIFLLLVPLVYGLILRSKDAVARAAGALAVGIGLWLTFPAWALWLGLGGRFVEEKALTVERLLGALQVTGWNRPTVSFLSALQGSATQYLSSYLLLAGGAVVLGWVWLRRAGEVPSFLAAWLICTFGFAGFTVARGQLNEQFFVYLMPGAAVAVVFALDAIILWARDRGVAVRRVGPGVAVALGAVAVLAVAVPVSATWNWVRLYATGRDDGIAQMVSAVDRRLPACDAVNASGDVQKYVFTLHGRTVTNFASGPQALSHGVRYFFLSPKDEFARYGKMSPDFAEWIRRNGELVESYPSHTYWGVHLWHVDPGPFSPIADVQPIQDGLFVNVRGSACGGFPVRNDAIGTFFDGYQAAGGKPTVGRPRSRSWRGADGVGYQLFDTMMLADRGAAVPEPAPLFLQLAQRAPGSVVAASLPLPTMEPDEGRARAGELVTDAFRALYLDTRDGWDAGDTWGAALDRWGAPLGPAVLMPDGMLRQPFEHVVMERRADGAGPPRLAVLADVAEQAGVVPADARRATTVPDIDPVPAPRLPSGVGPFLATLGGALAIWFVGALAVARTGRAVTDVRPPERVRTGRRVPRAVYRVPSEGVAGEVGRGG